MRFSWGLQKSEKGHKKIPRSLGSGYIDRDLGVYLTPDRISYLERGQLVRDKGFRRLPPLLFASGQGLLVEKKMMMMMMTPPVVEPW